ncbi:trypsin-like peptidase domain-containing protein [Verrucomicrobium sp. BvORR034]|uniref:trypsin-like peptidase domain-containing protein n=1 Tax=Verrucomicrobium sp. BvORR034 TaxID=1396418 RepID=UPI0009DCE6A7|nr:trypsin-like peptidase domain-containing protein [Verrucomicrobium sp. BvORR034]
MIANFACPHCQVSLKMDTTLLQGHIRCPSCGQVFAVEPPPPQPVIPVAILASPPTPPPISHAAAPVQATPTDQAFHPNPPPHKAPTRPGPPRPHSPGLPRPPQSPEAAAAKAAQEKAETNALYAMIGIGIVSFIALIFVIRWGMGWVEKRRIENSSSHQVAMIEAAQKKADDEVKRKDAEAANARREAERKSIRAQLSLHVTGGNDAVADALLTALEEVNTETELALQNGSLRTNVQLHMEQALLAKMTENTVLRKWFGAQGSPSEFVRAIYGLADPRSNIQTTQPALPGAVSPLFTDQKYRSMGTGFFVAQSGWLVTNHHVVRGAINVEVRTSGGKIVNARVVKSDEERDLALLKVEVTPGAWLPITMGEPSLGTNVFTVGFPQPTLQGIEPKFTEGTISSTRGLRDDENSYQISVPVQGGNSGGALVHQKSGWVVGVIRSKLTSNSQGEALQNVNYAVKSKALRSFIESIPDAKSLLDVPVASNPEDTDAIIEKVRSATVLVLIPN